MVVQVPTPTPLTGLKRPYSATIAADGTGRAEITPTSTWSWSVTQVSVELAAAPTGAAATIRVDGVFVTALIVTGDAAAGDPPVPLGVGETMTVEFTGCTPGQVATILVFYDEIAS